MCHVKDLIDGSYVVLTELSKDPYNLQKVIALITG